MKVNKKATVQRVRDFFENDYLTYLNLSNFSKYGLRSIDYTQPKVSYTKRTDALAELITKASDADLIILSIKQAISDCPERPRQPYRTILTNRYLKFWPAWQVANKISYSHSQYNKLQNQALLIFANRFAIQQVINQCYPIINLNIYDLS